jgi:ATP-dependent exoDNAse (exonuclease V) beta subunit
VRVAEDAVQVLTAHASKGLEWDVVCVAGVQEGNWPDLRMRGSFLGSERLVDLLRPGAEAAPPAVATAATLARLLEEERRLFYVAVTRARRALLVTAVASEREGLSPSRFLDELDPPRTAAGEPGVRPHTAVRRPLSLTSLVAELRQCAGDPAVDDQLRAAAAHRLATLAAAGARGADPRSWWGLAPASDDRPVREQDQPVAVSPSKVESFRRCELRWFLEHVGGADTSGAAQSVGTLVHAVAEGALAPELSTEEALLARLEQLLPTVDLGSGWVARKERAKAAEMVGRLARWLARNEREVVATELEFATQVGRARLGGRVDRLERDADGRAVVVDLKTGTSKVRAEELVEHGQLAAYQLAVEAGAFAAVGHGLNRSGGAELVQIGKAGGKDGAVQAQQPLAEADDPHWARRVVLEVAEGMAGSAFSAVDNRYCGQCPVRTSCPVQQDGRTVTG